MVFNISREKKELLPYLLGSVGHHEYNSIRLGDKWHHKQQGKRLRGLGISIGSLLVGYSIGIAFAFPINSIRLGLVKQRAPPKCVLKP